MAYPKKLEKLVGAALVRDHEFRDLLFKDPMAAAKSAGVRLTEEEAAHIHELLRHVERKKLESFAEDLHHIYSAYPGW
jgi:hypothetical protein